MVCYTGRDNLNHTAQKLQRTWEWWRDLPKARWQQSGDGTTASPAPWGDQARPPGPGAASTGTVLVQGWLQAQSCWHAGVGAIQHKLSHTVPAGTQRHPAPALTVVFIVYWCSPTKALVTCWVPCNAPCCWVLCAGTPGLSSMSPTLSWQLLTALLHWAARQSSSRDVGSSNNAEEGLTLGKTPHLFTDQSMLWPDTLQYLWCK